VATWHGHDGGRGVEQVFAAYGTVAVGGAFNTLMAQGVGDGYADIAVLHHVRIIGADKRRPYLAMHVVLAQSRTSSANTAVYAVVDLFVAVVVPQLADFAIIACRLHPALHTVLARLLGRATAHTEHVLRLHTIQVMVFHGIVTVSTRVPPPTLVALHLDVALVVLTS